MAPSKSALAVSLAALAATRVHCARFTYELDHRRHLDMPTSFFTTHVELQIGTLFDTILQSPPSHRQPIVLDVGANSGYYSLLAASHNASVYAFELQRTCVAGIKDRLTANPHLQSNVMVFNVGLGDADIIALSNDSDMCDGGFGTQGLTSKSGERGRRDSVAVIVPPTSVVQEWWTIDLVKMDTEGGEVGVLKHMIPLIKSGRVKNVIVEILPPAWHARRHSFEESAGLFAHMLALSKHAVLLHDPTEFPSAAVTPGPQVAGMPTWTVRDMKRLLQDRVDKSAGCNVWFQF